MLAKVSRFRAYPLLMKSKAGSKFLFWRASWWKNRSQPRVKPEGMLLRTHSRRSSGRNLAGTAAIEFGVAVPVLAVLVTGIVEVGYSMYQAMQTSYAAEAGLFYATKNGWDPTGIASAAASATGLSGMTVTPTQFCGCPGATGIAAAACTSSCASGPASQYIQINVSIPRISIIGNSGFGLPATLSAQSILRQN